MQIEYRKFDSNRKFGIELEVEPTVDKKTLSKYISYHEFHYGLNRDVKVEDEIKGWAESINNNYWHVKYDSTCGQKGYKKDAGGWEIASYIGSGSIDIENISNIAKFLHECGVVVNDNCGLHVHVDVSDFSVRNIGVLLAYWLKIEKFILHACPIHRKKNKYCKSLRPKLDEVKYMYDSFYGKHKKDKKAKPIEQSEFYNPISLWDILKPSNLGSHENVDKKVTLNTVGVARAITLEDFKRPTVELRVPECLLDKSHVANWIKLIVNFVEFCKDKEMPLNLNSTLSIKETLNLLGLEDVNKFIILDTQLSELKVWFCERLSKFCNLKKLQNQTREKIAFITKI